MKIVAVALPSAAFLITCFFVLEFFKYRSGWPGMSRRRLVLRFVAWALAVGLCAGLFTGLFLVSKTFVVRHPWAVLALWTGCFAAAFALLGVVFADMKEVEAGVRAREAELWKGFAEDVAERERGKRKS